MSEQKKQLKKFDLVEGPGIKLGVIISDQFTAHFFADCVASQAAEFPFDITDQKSYEYEIDDMVLVYVFVREYRGLEMGLDTEAMTLASLRSADIDGISSSGYFDASTGILREVLSVKKFAEDIWKRAKEAREKESRG